jgi:hypothetical protein
MRGFDNALTVATASLSGVGAMADAGGAPSVTAVTVLLALITCVTVLARLGQSIMDYREKQAERAERAAGRGPAVIPSANLAPAVPPPRAHRRRNRPSHELRPPGAHPKPLVTPREARP